jgi:hypothetical protein
MVAQTPLLQVKTLGPSRPGIHYEPTRRFYTRMGFLPLQELLGLWPANPCLLMAKLLPALPQGAVCTQ